jgi:hypothetical protein
MEKISWALLISELSLFWRLSIHPSMCANPLAWWQIYEDQFPNVDLFTKQILRIPKSQIKIEIIFAWMVFWQLWCASTSNRKIWIRLIIVIIKFDLMTCTCTPNTNLMNYMKPEIILDKGIYQFIKQAKYFEKL